METFPYRGSVVKQISAKEISDIYDVRIALESLAVRFAASRLTDEQLRELETHMYDYERALEAGDRHMGLRADWAFHELLLGASGNEVLLNIASNLANRIQLLRQVDWEEATRTEPLYGHRLILEALRQSDGDEAAKLIADHISRGKQKVLQALKAGEAELK